jgi:pimeloyl-ACP methyl ester carboxylesterase
MYPSDELPRRPFLGVELRARREGTDTLDGVEVVRVADDGAAARAGVRGRDRLTAINGQSVHEPAQIVALARSLAPGEPLTFDVARDRARTTLSGAAVPLPVERINGAELRLDHVGVNGHRLRTFLTIPVAGRPPFTAVLYLQGLGCASCELSQDPDDPLRALFEGWSRSGLATLRVERSGVGDSEGPPCRETDFFAELAAYRAALDALGRHRDIARTVLFGHSVGGMIAPLLAGEGDGVSGVVVFGSSSLRWYDCIVRATRRQRLLAGLAGEALDAHVAAWGELHARVCRDGLMPAEVFSRYPHLSTLEGSACHGETMFGRHVSFFQQLQRLDLAALWGTVSAPVLVLHGAYDWVCAPEEGQGIADAVSGPLRGRARFVELAQIGHDLRRHESLSQSYAHPRQGKWDGSLSLLSAMSAWLRDNALTP